MRAASLLAAFLLMLGCRRPPPPAPIPLLTPRVKPPVTHAIDGHGISIRLPGGWEVDPGGGKWLFRFQGADVVLGTLTVKPGGIPVETSADWLVESWKERSKEVDVLFRGPYLGHGIRFDALLGPDDGNEVRVVAGLIEHRGRSYDLILSGKATEWYLVEAEVAAVLDSVVLSEAPAPATEPVRVQGRGYSFELPAGWAFTALDPPEEAFVGLAWAVGGSPSAVVLASPAADTLFLDRFLQKLSAETLERTQGEAAFVYTIHDLRLQCFARGTSTHVLCFQAKAVDYTRHKDVFERAGRSLR